MKYQELLKDLKDGVYLKDGQEIPNLKTKLVWIDPIYGEFTSPLNSVLLRGSNHPLAVKAKRAATNTEKYGGVSPFSSKQTHNKSKQTVKEKYGVNNVSHLQSTKDKISQANRGLADQALNRRVETVKNRYGVENVSQLSEVTRKVKETHKVNLINAQHILPNGRSVAEYCKVYNKNQSHARKVFISYGGAFCQKYIETHKSIESSLERLFRESWDDEIIKPISQNQKYCEEIHKATGLQRKPDFIIEHNGKKLHIECDGLSYHSELLKKDSKYHMNKRQLYESVGLTLLQFRQDEIVFKLPIVKSIIKAKLGIFNRRFNAKDLDIKIVQNEEYKEFYNNNHLMGSMDAPTIGLYSGNELVCALSYKKKDNGVDITRMATKLNTQVNGGLSRLLKYVENSIKPKFIQYFVDLRYGTGKYLKSNGYTVLEPTLGFKWTDCCYTFDRTYCQAGEGKAEQEKASELKLYKIYDAGQQKLIKHLTSEST